jgi:O-antigen/teichoic acid export membrane protein
LVNPYISSGSEASARGPDSEAVALTRLRTGIGDARRVARNSVFQALAFVAQGLTGFVVAVVLARLVGPEHLGEFTTLVILAGLFAFIADFGLPGLLTREISRLRHEPEKATALLNTALGLVLVLSVVAFGLMTGLGLLSGYSGALARALAITAAALAVESGVMVILAAFRGVEALGPFSAVIGLMEVGFLVLVIGFIFLDPDIDAIMAAYLVSRLAALGLTVRLYRARFGRLRPAASRDVWLALLRRGLPFSVNSVFSYSYSRADIVLLSYLAGNVTVGFYEAVYSLTMRTNVIARAVTLALYPLLAFQFRINLPNMRAYAAAGIRSLHVPAFGLAGILWLFGVDLVSFLYGPDFAKASVLGVKLLAVALPFRFLETSLGVVLDASDRSGRRAGAVAAAAIANLILNLALIPRFGLLGAVYATLIAEVFISGVFLWHLRRELGEIIDPRGLVGPLAGVAVILGAGSILKEFNTWVLLVICVGLYVGTIVALDRPAIRWLYRVVTSGQS